MPPIGPIIAFKETFANKGIVIYNIFICIFYKNELLHLKEINMKQHEELELDELLDEDGLEIIDLGEDESEQPDRKKKIKNIIYDVAIGLGIAMLVFGGVSLYKEFSSGEEAKNGYENLNNLVVSRPSDDNNSEGTGDSQIESTRNWYELVSVDMNELKKINEDIVGWIFFENEDISYPIMYSLDSTKYDRMLYDGTESISGSIILD